jgi:hypothetical protein
VRGYYDGESGAGLPALLARVRYLQGEAAPPPGSERHVPTTPPGDHASKQAASGKR